MTNLSACAGRVLLSLLFILAGFNKIIGYAGTAAYMQSQGVSSLLLPLVIILELGGGLLILVGFQTRIVAFLMAGFCVLSALLFHSNFADQTQITAFLKNIALAGGFLILLAHGPGELSVDEKLSDSRAETH